MDEQAMYKALRRNERRKSINAALILVGTVVGGVAVCAVLYFMFRVEPIR